MNSWALKKHYTQLIIGIGYLLFSINSYSYEYKLMPNKTKQVIEGLGVELQLDSIGSGNNGLPEQSTGIPHDLISSERERLYNEMLKGFRYARLAMGLYYRGLTPDQKNLTERYPGQLAEVREIILESGMQGAAAEYWSPPPYWKENRSYIGGPLKLDIDYDAFADSVVKDLRHFTENDIPIIRWTLNNEPFTNNTRFSNVFFPADGVQYRDAFKAVASKVREFDPSIFIHAESGHGQHSKRVQLFHDDPSILKLVDGWTWHKIGTNSNDQIERAEHYNSKTHGKPVYNNEFEYLSGGTSVPRMINTAQSIMNWMTFVDSPTWYWLHALKPTYNEESEGYGLGLWRPEDDTNFGKYAQIKPHHWDYLKTNYNAIAGFLKYMPWNSIRFEVFEKKIRKDQRIMAWLTPDNQKVFVVTNRGTEPFTFEIEASDTSTHFAGYRYDENIRDHYLGDVQGTNLKITVPSMSIEYWVEETPSAPEIEIIALHTNICESSKKNFKECPNKNKSAFKISRNGDLKNSLKVRLINRSSASLDNDILPIDLDVEFQKNQADILIPITAINDNIGEVLETISLELAISSTYNLNKTKRATIYLNDDNDPMLNWVGIYPSKHKNQLILKRHGDNSPPLTVYLQYKGSLVKQIEREKLIHKIDFKKEQQEIIIDLPLQKTMFGDISVAIEPNDTYYVSSPITTLKIGGD